MSHWLTPRRITLATLGLLSIVMAATALAGWFSPADHAAVGLGASMTFVFVGLFFAAFRGWPWAQQTAALALALVTGLALPEPFVSGVAPAVVILPAIVALLLTDPLWVVGVQSVTITTLAARAGFTGVYMQPLTAILLIAIALIAALSRVLVDRALQEARDVNRRLEERVAERTAELQAANEHLEQRVRHQRETYAAIAHDLRNDSVRITGAADLLIDAVQDEDADELRRCERQLSSWAGRLERYAADLLDLAVAEQLRLRPADIDLVDLAAAVTESLQVEAEQARIKLTFLPPPGPVPLVCCDPDRFRRVLLNLVGNAIKFTFGHGSHVMVSVAYQGGQVAVLVHDDGRGIEPEKTARLGERFLRVVRGEHPPEGKGIGLSFCRQIVAASSGTLSITSAGLGCGTTAIVALPALDCPVAVQPAIEKHYAPSSSVQAVA